MKKKNKRESVKIKKKPQKPRKRKKLRGKKKIQNIKIIEKRKKSRKIKKKSRRSRKEKKLKIRKKVKHIEIAKETKSFRIRKQLALLKKLTIKKMLNFILQPFVKLYQDLQEKRKIKKLKKINFERKEKEREIKEEERLRKQMKEYEFRDEVRIARMRSQDLKRFIKKENAILRRELAEKRHRFLESIRLEKKISAYKRRELEQIKRQERLALQEEREDYRPVLDRLAKIKEKYRLIRQQKVKERLETLGLKISASEATNYQELINKEKDFLHKRNNIEQKITPFIRNLQSLCFQLNRRHRPPSFDLLRLIDKIYDEGEMYIRFDTKPEESWLMLVCLQDPNDPDKGLILENKCNPDKIEKKHFPLSSLFAFSDYCVDNLVQYISRSLEKKKAS